MFSDVFHDSSVARILDLLAMSSRDFSLTELSEECGVSYRTIQRIFPLLVQKEIVVKTRQIGKATMYSLNLEHPKMKELHRIMADSAIDNAHHIAYS